jgi:hypothetical protein
MEFLFPAGWRFPRDAARNREIYLRASAPLADALADVFAESATV